MEDEDLVSVSKHMTADERLKLFDMLCEAVKKRVPERVSLELGIKRPNVYKYMPYRNKRLVPSPETTGKVIKALMRYGRTQEVLPFLEVALARMLKAYKSVFLWVKKTRYTPWEGGS